MVKLGCKNAKLFLTEPLVPERKLENFFKFKEGTNFNRFPFIPLFTIQALTPIPIQALTPILSVQVTARAEPLRQKAVKLENYHLH
jgi:hypothetical protein